MNLIEIEMDFINVILRIIQSKRKIFLSIRMVSNDYFLCSFPIDFIVGARSIDRQWTELTEFHENLLTTCRPVYFNGGYNEQFIELIDSKQTVRYNRDALLVKHIRSTTHLFCKLFLDTRYVGIRVQTLIKESILNLLEERQLYACDDIDLGSPLLSDQSLKNNDYLEMKSNERDIYRIAFEGSDQNKSSFEILCVGRR